MQQLLLMFLNAKKEKIYPVHVSKRHSNRKKRQFTLLLMIENREKRKVKSEGHKAKSEGRQLWGYLAVKNCQRY